MGNKVARLAEGQRKVWRSKGNNGKRRLIPLDEMSDDHLQRAYFVTQNKELEHVNKLVIFTDLKEDIESEAIRRGLPLRSIENEKGHKIGKYFSNSRKNESK